MVSRVEQVNKVLDYIPGVSAVSNLTIIISQIAVAILGCISNNAFNAFETKHPHLYNLLSQKKSNYCLLLTIPILNIIITKFCYDKVFDRTRGITPQQLQETPTEPFLAEEPTTSTLLKIDPITPRESSANAIAESSPRSLPPDPETRRDFITTSIENAITNPNTSVEIRKGIFESTYKILHQRYSSLSLNEWKKSLFGNSQESTPPSEPPTSSSPEIPPSLKLETTE